MEDILASIKKVIAEEKELRTTVAPEPTPSANERDDDVHLAPDFPEDSEEEVLELNERLAPLAAADPGPPLVDDKVADQSRQALDELSTVAASVPPPPQTNPLEDMVREMLRPMLKQWLDDHLPKVVEEHVKREISRITGRPL